MRIPSNLASQLVTVKAGSNGVTVVSLPVFDVAGSHMTVRIKPAGYLWQVSDWGYGLMASGMAAADYPLHASDVAKEFGIQWDSDEGALVTTATDEQLPGAIATVASASLRAVMLACFFDDFMSERE